MESLIWQSATAIIVAFIAIVPTIKWRNRKVKNRKAELKFILDLIQEVKLLREVEKNHCEFNRETNNHKGTNKNIVRRIVRIKSGRNFSARLQDSRLNRKLEQYIEELLDQK